MWPSLLDSNQAFTESKSRCMINESGSLLMNASTKGSFIGNYRRFIEFIKATLHEDPPSGSFPCKMSAHLVLLNCVMTRHFFNVTKVDVVLKFPTCKLAVSKLVTFFTIIILFEIAQFF